MIEHALPAATPLDGLIRKLKQTGDRDDRSMLIEHLETANSYLRGVMPEECLLNLGLAREAVSGITEEPLRQEASHLIGDLEKRLDRTATSTSAAGLPEVGGPHLREYFAGCGTSFGIFAPKDHLVAVFSSYEGVERGQQRLKDASFAGEVAATGAEMREFLVELRAERTFPGQVMAEVSRSIDTEASLEDQYLKDASSDCGFLFVIAKTEAEATQIGNLLAGLGPVRVHWFASGGIHSLAN